MERHDLPVPWRFVPMPGTRVLFETSPLACDHLADLAELSPTQAGIGPRGFAVIALAL